MSLAVEFNFLGCTLMDDTGTVLFVIICLGLLLGVQEIQETEVPPKIFDCACFKESVIEGTLAIVFLDEGICALFAQRMTTLKSKRQTMTSVVSVHADLTAQHSVRFHQLLL
jgi:hypothetical protein